MTYMLVQVNSNKNPNVCVEMERQIGQLMKSGWEPLGGIAIYSFSDDMGQTHQILYQSVVRNQVPATRTSWAGESRSTPQYHHVEQYQFEPCMPYANS